MARFDLVLFYRLSVALTFISVVNCSMFDLDHVDGMKVINVNPATFKRDAKKAYRFFKSDIRDSLSSRMRRSASGFNYPSNRTGSGLSKEFEFHGDNHTVAFLYWLGSKSQVIFIFTANHKSIRRNAVGSIYADSAYLWRSKDYGSTFHRDDLTKFTKGKSISGIRFCKSNNQKVVAFDKVGKLLYVSKDGGESYKFYKLDFTPYDVQCNSKMDNMMVAYDGIMGKLYYTNDGGAKWSFLCVDVVKYYWVLDGVGTNAAQVFIEVKTKGRYHSSVLQYAELPCDSSQVKVFDPQLGSFEPRSFSMEGHYMFTRKHYPSSGFYVSYNQSKFQKAVFPLQFAERDYSVVDASEDEVLVCVNHITFYSLYVSDKLGTKYSLSLHRIFVSKSIHWGQKLVLADIHRVKSLRGVYLANVLLELKTDVHRHQHYIQTMITFDKGGSWHPLRIPIESQRSCQWPKCFLNLHMTFSQHHFQISSVVSSKSAVGLIMAQGNLGPYLSGNPDVYLSSDGGLTWKKVLSGIYDFVFGDHGGIIIAVPLRNNSRTIWYSCTEGNTWNTTTVDRSFHAYGLVTEPGESTLISNIFGQHSFHKFEWLSVKLNFTSVFSEQCSDSDYTFWTPVDERINGNCSLGEQLLYKRRKAETCCFNGMDYDVYINKTTCTCADEDYMCDTGFERDNTLVCDLTNGAVIIPQVCPELTTYWKSSGYRKVPGDRCSGGIEKDLEPVKTPCPTTAPDGIEIVLGRTTIASQTQIVFQLHQGKGSTETTWYLWDFGDGTAPSNVTSLQKAQNRSHVFSSHGEFNVTVTAANKAGGAYTKIVVRVIDEIRRVRIDPPHAVLVGKQALFNLTLYSSHTLSWQSEHGFVHFVWNFEPNQKPDLTWENEVQHVFKKADYYEVTVEAINEISRSYSSVTVIVHDELLTLRLFFNDELDKENKGTIEWRDEFGEMVLAELVTVLGVKRSRFEVAVLPGLPTLVDISILPRDSNESLTMNEIMEKIEQVVERGALEVTLSGNKVAKAVYAEILDNSGKKHTPKPNVDDSQDRRLAIAVGLAAGIVVLFLAGIVIYVYRRYTWLYQRYHRLSMNGDALVPLQSCGEGLGYDAHGEAVRYTVPGDDISGSDDELIGEIRPAGALLVIDDEPNQEEASPTAPEMANA